MELIIMLPRGRRAKTQRDAAEFLGVSVSSLRQWRRNLIGPRHFIKNGEPLYPVRHLETFQKARTKSSPSKAPIDTGS